MTTKEIIELVKKNFLTDLIIAVVLSLIFANLLDYTHRSIFLYLFYVSISVPFIGWMVRGLIYWLISIIKKNGK